jgi:hypothetical protein
MATERDFELLDDYLTNRLRGAEKSAFENKLQADPDLMREHQMQERLVKAIKDARVTELKSILNNVPVSPINHGGTSVVAKFALGTFVAGLVATGVYFYFDKDEQAAETTEVSIVPKTGTQDETITEEQPQNITTEMPSQTEASTSEPVLKTPADEQTASKPVIDVFDPASETTTTDVEEPAAERRNTSRAGAPSITVQIERQNKTYHFNYQFKDGQLLLYGPFEKNLYEILEFFSDEKRTVFLYYKGAYYLLKDDGEQVKELSPVSDPNLIKKLKEYRAN